MANSRRLISTLGMRRGMVVRVLRQLSAAGAKVVSEAGARYLGTSNAGLCKNEAAFSAAFHGSRRRLGECINYLDAAGARLARRLPPKTLGSPFHLPVSDLVLHSSFLHFCFASLEKVPSLKHLITSLSFATKMASATRQFARVATHTTARNAFSVAPRQVFRQHGRRYYSSEPAQKSSSAWIWLTGAAVAGGAGYYFYANGATSATPKVFAPTKEDYQKVYNEIAARLDEKDDYDDGSYAPVLLRLAWHASGTYDKETGTGGSNGATMRFAPESDHGANAGLIAARNFLEPVKKKFPWITYSDLWILSGVCAIQEMQGPIIPYRPGRSDRDVSACTPDGRLPDATKASGHLRDIFYRMGFNDQEIVALSGAHALGRCHTDRSGFTGPWTFSPTVLTNDYFRLLIEEKWQWKKWNGPAQYEDKSTKTLMMLPSDMALVQDKQLKPYVEKYAKDNDAFFKDFSAVVLRLFELGVPFAQGTENQRWTFKPTWDS